jgi:CTD small phosphatase-like protein 2
VVLDLDETLIHCNESVDLPHDVALEISFPNNSKIRAGINVRPYASECLRELSQHYEVIVFTASHHFYANVILDYLDPHHQYIAHRFFRDSCHKSEEGFYVKDLRVLGRDLANVLLVDNVTCGLLRLPIAIVSSQKTECPLSPSITTRRTWSSRK